MKLLRWSLFLFVLVAFLGGVGIAQAQDIPEEPDDVIQVVLVLDVSSSMEEPILSDDLPEEFLSLVDELNAARENPELDLIIQQIDAVLDDPEVATAREAYDESVALLDDWFAEQEYALNQAALLDQVGQALADLGCDPMFAQPIVTAMTIDEIDYWITQSCSAVSISFEAHQALRDQVPYVGEVEYTALQESSDTAYQIYFDALEARQYNQLIDQRDQKRMDLNIDGLAADLDAKILELGIPRKLDLAKLAAKTLVDLSRLDSAAGRRNSVLALVRFSTDHVLLQELTPDHDIVEQKIEALDSLEMTNIYGGMDEALTELERHANPEDPIVVLLLSDGHITVGPGPETVLEEIPPRANDLDAVICTVGFGATEAHVDYVLLHGLADATEGEYLFAETGEELVNFFIACRQGVVGNVTQLTGYVSAGAPAQLEPVTVPENVCEISMALNSVSGEPILDILDAEGQRIDDGYPDFAYQTGDNLKLYTILNPAPGQWQVSVHSEKADEEFFSIVITTDDCQPSDAPAMSPTPYLTSTPMPAPGVVEQVSPVFPLIVLVIVVMGIFILITLRKS